MRSRFVHSIAACLWIVLLASPARGQKGPASDEAVAEKLRAARELMAKDRLEEAAVVYEDLVTNHRDHPSAARAAELLLDSLNGLKKYDRMREWVERLLADEAFLRRHPKLAERLAMLEHQFLRKQAEELEHEKKYGACGKAYLEIFNRDPTAPRGDEVLYNAGVCFEKARAVGSAVTAHSILLRRFPKSRIARKAMIRLATAYQTIAWYDRAAEMYARYARTYGGERDASDALIRAIELRYGLGQPEKARAASERFAKIYGRKQKRQTAQLMFRATEDDDPAREVARLRRYLKNWGRAGGPGLVVRARARLGELLWQGSCPAGKGSTAPCVRITRGGGPRRCEAGRRVAVRTRDARDVAVARKELETAIKVYEQLRRSTSPDDRALTHAGVEEAYAKARFYLAERDYEAYLALRFPRKLDFDPRNKTKERASVRRFTAWYKRKQKTYADLAGGGYDGASKQGTYSELARHGPSAGPWSTAAAARVGQMAVDFSENLLSGEVPVDVRKGPFAAEKQKAYCDALRDQAEPLAHNAVAAFTHCMEGVKAKPRFNRWYTVCQRELERFRPEEFPAAREIRGTADHLGPILDREAVATSAPAAAAE